MKVFLIIVAIILVEEILKFILNAIDSFFGKKRLENEVSILKSQLESANSIIKQNNEVIEGMARNASRSMQFSYGNRNASKEEIEAVRYAVKKSHPDNGGNADDFMRFQKVYEELTRK